MTESMISCSECHGTGKVKLLPSFTMEMIEINPSDNKDDPKQLKFNITFTKFTSEIIGLILMGPTVFKHISVQDSNGKSFIINLRSEIMEISRPFFDPGPSTSQKGTNNTIFMPLSFRSLSRLESKDSEVAFLKTMQRCCSSVVLTFVFESDIDPSLYKLLLKTKSVGSD